ncbi:integrase [Plantactinospora sp. BC1]|uniref:tyrosine-type recombinase/integrase n=1 Tax=Plantactinospora sp. BC1 TaxID=2108470 RepID=UPI000D159291|nr:tyrosine-type recombinase/integrase [Plantactinospora sp. BC1]AVT32471.1 integrase [Plantactinospora sp. BC1]
MSRRRTDAGRPDDRGARRLSHDVRIWALRVQEGKRGKTYAVRWTVAEKEHHKTFRTRALADGFRAQLLSATQRGTPFDVTSGLPETMLREQQSKPWYDHACRYVDMKWPAAAPKSRTGVAETLTTVTPALLSTERGRPDHDTLRQALYAWAFVAPRRQAGDPPPEFAAAIRWLERNTVALADFDDPSTGPELTRRALDALALRLDGRPAAPRTVARKRAVFYNALAYAVELGILSGNPIDRITWKTPKTVETVDRRRAAINPGQARALLAAVREQSSIGRRLAAFFACMYYGAARPGEALEIRRENLARLPEEGWGELLLTSSAPRTGTAWTDSGRSRERRGLKHRAARDTRPVPAHPELVAFLREHLEEFGTAPDGRLFVGPRGGTIGESTYLTVWHRARAAALTPAEAASPLASVPYDLRHAAVSTWLNGGVPATQVAEWAGHSVEVLLRTYAKCIVGQDELARRRIEEALKPDDDQDEGAA